MATSQNYSNHGRYSPLYHFVAVPILTINLGLTLAALGRRPSFETAWAVVFAVGVAAVAVVARLMALTVQNRLIRLEERLRLARLLGPEQQAVIAELPTRALIALRFASDEEVPGLVEQIRGGALTTPDTIKRAIRHWRPDYLRA